ncbi:MAG: potassium transporter TrkG [Candidatus Aenigmatarchaeota archaeon]
MKNLLANLGFILQFSGILILLNAFIAIYLNEIKEAIAFFLTSSIFILIGFPLNALSERKEINFRDSLILFLLTFLFLGLIGSIPYLYLDIFKDYPLEEKIVNSLFESFSGYTTTGFSFINSELPKSLILYRSFSQFIGGIGIVYLFLTFLYSSQKISRVFNRIIGFKVNSEIKKNILEILIYFSLSALILSLLMFYFNKDLLKSFSLVISGISTGGFSHYNLQLLTFEEKVIIITSMVLGSISIFILSKLKKEIVLYIILILSTTFVLNYFLNLDFFDSFFHAVSLTSTTGYSYIDFSKANDFVLLYCSIIMLFGGMAISTSGGIKLIRVINTFKFLIKKIKAYILAKEEKLENFSIVYFILYFIFLFFFSLFFSLNYSSSKSIFEVASSLATAGFSSGIINIEISVQEKILFIILMLLGRIEIIPIFALFIKNYVDNKV